MSKPVRVRFAPSPTGPLHIGGVRTALYNYLYAKHFNGTFILRIEDTDQNRYVPGAEEYIREALAWIGLKPDEGPTAGGEYGPYRQSQRKSVYSQYTDKLLESGNAYYAFDTTDALSAAREQAEANGDTFKYDWKTRKQLKNSLNMSQEEVKSLLSDGTPYVVRLKVVPEQDIVFQDLVRGEVRYNSSELDDKVLLKADGMPTYHMANVVDDYLMKISHVIRGEEWLPSTPTHVLLYKGLGISETMPQFCHVPLLLKPTGKGKLSKRDGSKFGIPVFPLDWTDPETGEQVDGFRERGFEPEAMTNFLALLGWSPGDDQELFSLEELVKRFESQRIQKSGARFDFDKAAWFNQQYLLKADPEDLLPRVKALLAERGHPKDEAFVRDYIGLFQERVHFFPDFYSAGYYFFEAVTDYEDKMLRKKWKAEKRPVFDAFLNEIKGLSEFSAQNIESLIKAFLEKNGLGFGDIFPVLRIALTGSTKGPSVFEMMELMGQEMVSERLEGAYSKFDEMLAVN